MEPKKSAHQKAVESKALYSVADKSEITIVATAILEAPRPTTPTEVPQSRTPSPPSPVPGVSQLTKDLRKMALAEAPAAKPPVAVKLVAAKSVAIRPAFMLASRVKDWFARPGSVNDPFIKDPKYNTKKFSEYIMFWIRVEHNFALCLDKFIEEGKDTTDKKVLATFKAKRRIQFIAQISVNSDTINETRTGVITYAIGESGRVFHRWFTPKDRAEILNPGVEKGWEVLESLDDALDDIEGDMQDIADIVDGSKVTSITDNLITAIDPKNKNAIITLVRMKS